MPVHPFNCLSVGSILYLPCPLTSKCRLYHCDTWKLTHHLHCHPHKGDHAHVGCLHHFPNGWHTVVRKTSLDSHRYGVQTTGTENICHYLSFVTWTQLWHLQSKRILSGDLNWLLNLYLQNILCLCWYLDI